MTSVSAHVLVKNEARFLWYAIRSVIEHVDQVLVLDTGSSDTSWEIAQTFKKTKWAEKIILEQQIFEPFNEELVRQKMLDQTETDWFLVVDGNEIWWKDSINQVVDTIKKEGQRIESIVIPTVNLVGDMYHYQEAAAGNYHLAGRVGHLNLRAVNRAIPGLHSFGEHGVWGWVDETNTMIQDRNPEQIKFLDAPYLHTTFLQRSVSSKLDDQVLKRKPKHKHELGIPFPLDYYYPEAFFAERPDIVPSVWETMDSSFYLQSLLETPLRKIKRRLLPKKIGY